MHTRWDFDASNAQTQKGECIRQASDLKRKCIIFVTIFEHKEKNVVVNVIHTCHKQNVFVFICDKYKDIILLSSKCY